jgi:hypothetical protein
VRGAGGGGEGEPGERTSGGTSGRFGMTLARWAPHLIRSDDVTWVAAADTTRRTNLSQVMAIAGLHALRSILRTRDQCLRRLWGSCCWRADTLSLPLTRSDPTYPFRFPIRTEELLGNLDGTTTRFPQRTGARTSEV